MARPFGLNGGGTPEGRGAVNGTPGCGILTDCTFPKPGNVRVKRQPSNGRRIVPAIAAASIDSACRDGLPVAVGSDMHAQFRKLMSTTVLVGAGIAVAVTNSCEQFP